MQRSQVPQDFAAQRRFCGHAEFASIHPNCVGAENRVL